MAKTDTFLDGKNLNDAELAALNPLQRHLAVTETVTRLHKDEGVKVLPQNARNTLAYSLGALAASGASN